MEVSRTAPVPRLGRIGTRRRGGLRRKATKTRWVRQRMALEFLTSIVAGRSNLKEVVPEDWRKSGREEETAEGDGGDGGSLSASSVENRVREGRWAWPPGAILRVPGQTANFVRTLGDRGDPRFEAALLRRGWARGQNGQSSVRVFVSRRRTYPSLICSVSPYVRGDADPIEGEGGLAGEVEGLKLLLLTRRSVVRREGVAGGEEGRSSSGEEQEEAMITAPELRSLEGRIFRWAGMSMGPLLRPNWPLRRAALRAAARDARRGHPYRDAAIEAEKSDSMGESGRNKIVPSRTTNTLGVSVTVQETQLAAAAGEAGMPAPLVEAVRALALPAASLPGAPPPHEMAMGSIPYDPHFVDPPSIQAGRAPRADASAGLVCSVQRYLSEQDEREQVDARFAARHPWLPPELGIKLSSLRDVRRRLISAAADSQAELCTVAYAFALLDKLLLARRVNNATLPEAACACFLLAYKFIQPGPDALLADTTLLPSASPALSPIAPQISQRSSRKLSFPWFRRSASLPQSPAPQTSTATSEVLPEAPRRALPLCGNVVRALSLHLRVAPARIRELEFPVFIRLGFSLHLPLPDVLPHMRRLQDSLQDLPPHFNLDLDLPDAFFATISNHPADRVPNQEPDIRDDDDDDDEEDLHQDVSSLVEYQDEQDNDALQPSSTYDMPTPPPTPLVVVPEEPYE